MDEVITQAANPIYDYVFGAFCLILLGVLIYGGRAWRSDMKEWNKGLATLLEVSTQVIANNSTSNKGLSEALGKFGDNQDYLCRTLLSRPCLKDSSDSGGK